MSEEATPKPTEAARAESTPRPAPALPAPDYLADFEVARPAADRTAMESGTAAPAPETADATTAESVLVDIEKGAGGETAVVSAPGSRIKHFVAAASAGLRERAKGRTETVRRVREVIWNAKGTSALAVGGGVLLAGVGYAAGGAGEQAADTEPVPADSLRLSGVRSLLQNVEATLGSDALRQSAAYRRGVRQAERLFYEGSFEKADYSRDLQLQIATHALPWEIEQGKGAESASERTASFERVHRWVEDLRQKDFRRYREDPTYAKLIYTAATMLEREYRAMGDTAREAVAAEWVKEQIGAMNDPEARFHPVEIGAQERMVFENAALVAGAVTEGASAEEGRGQRTASRLLGTVVRGEGEQTTRGRTLP